MNFTREPIIETIISPKDGHKLLVRNSKGGGAEEYYVDAVEVVAFGNAFFFRSLERPKSFIVPVSDYEILEVREPRVALKNVSHERNIKIGGGREAPVRASSREREPQEEVAEEAPAVEAGAVEVAIESRMDKRRDRRRHRRRRGGPDEQEWTDRRPQEQHKDMQISRPPATGEGGGEDETRVSSPTFSHLFPPPPTLISETIGRYKDKEFSEGNAIPKAVEEPPASAEKKEKRKEEDDSESGSSQLSRVLIVESTESVSFSSESQYPTYTGFNRLF